MRRKRGGSVMFFNNPKLENFAKKVGTDRRKNNGW